MRKVTIQQLASSKFARARVHYQVEIDAATEQGAVQVPRFGEMVEATAYHISDVGSDTWILAAIPLDSHVQLLDEIAKNKPGPITIQGQWYKSSTGGMLIVQSVIDG